MYGGHVFNDWDRRLTSTYLDLWLRCAPTVRAANMDCAARVRPESPRFFLLFAAQGRVARLDPVLPGVRVHVAAAAHHRRVQRVHRRELPAGDAGGTSNVTNQPQVLHTSTCKCTDRTCLMSGLRAALQRRDRVPAAAGRRHVPGDPGPAAQGGRRRRRGDVRAAIMDFVCSMLARINSGCV